MAQWEFHCTRVESEMKLVLVELIRLFECGLVPQNEAEIELMLTCLVKSANKRFHGEADDMKQLSLKW